MPTLFGPLQSGRDIDPEPPEKPTSGSLSSRQSGSSSKMGASRTSQVRVEVRREFLRSTAKGSQDEVFTNPEILPSIEDAYNSFQRTYPKFSETWAVDDLRDREYFHLEESQHVCMDYCGFGLFSYYQQIVNKAAASFSLAYISANLPTHALYGAADEGTVEFFIRKRVMDYLNINDTEYCMVFTATRGAAFKLLAESYPFHLNPKLLTVYDFESEAVSWMVECAKQKGAKIMSACFKWPALRIGTSHLKKLLLEKKKKGEPAKGLFVFPVQSRMTGAKYSSQWMSEAQQNKWHVLLDASSLGPKDMDSLGLSLFRPDFIISSFYKVFGTDPTGFGCLFIKKTAIQSLENSSRARAVGMVRIVSLSNSTLDGAEGKDSEDDGEIQLHRRSIGENLSSFSGPFFTAVDAEVKLKHTSKESKHRSWKSWKKTGKMARHSSREHSGHLPRSNGGMETVNRVGKGVSEVEFAAKTSKSRRHRETRTPEMDKEQSNGARATGRHKERHRRLYEVQELEGKQVSEVGVGLRHTNPPWRSQGRVTEIEETHKPIEFQSLVGEGISPIREVEMEEHEVEESERCSQAGDRANGSSGHNMVFSNGLQDGGANEIEEGAVDLGANGLHVLPQFDVEAVVDEERRDSSAVEQLQQGSGLDLRESGSEESPESNLTDRRPQHPVNEESEVQEVGESSDFFPSGSNDTVQRTLLWSKPSELGSQDSVKARLRSFRRRPSFNRHTGKQLSDFQEMGVQGLVKKFQGFRGASAVDKEIEGTVDGELDLCVDEGSGPGRTEYLQPSSPRVPDGSSEVRKSPRSTQDVAEVEEKEDNFEEGNSGQFNASAETCTSSLSTITQPTGDAEEVRGAVAENCFGHAVSETASRSPAAGSERVSVDPLREVRVVDECERSPNLNTGQLPTLETAIHHIAQHSSTFRGHGRTPYEPGEENYITFLPSRSGKNWSKRVPETLTAAKTSDSKELSYRETSSATEREQMEHMPTKDDSSSSPPKNFIRVEHAGKEERLSNSRRSQSIQLDDNLPTATTIVCQVGSPNLPRKERSVADNVTFDDTDFHGTEEQGMRNGRSDLRSNRTLSRNVDFEDDRYPGRSSYASEMFESRREPTAFLEGRFDMEEGDEDSFRSHSYSRSLHGSSSLSRYLADDLPLSSYLEGEEGYTEDEYDDILEAELQEDQEEAIISCKGLDFADSLGLTKLNYRLRYLINWLVNSLLKLRHPGPNQGIPLVRIYGPKVKYDRGAAVSFNMFDWKGLLIQPGLVQRLADRRNISLGVGKICNIVDPEMSPDFTAEQDRILGVGKTDHGGAGSSPYAGKLEVGKSGGAGDSLTIPVVTAAMGFVSSFEDVYKLWSFLAKFLDADYVSKEAWRYHSLNQQTMVM